MAAAAAAPAPGDGATRTRRPDSAFVVVGAGGGADGRGKLASSPPPRSPPPASTAPPRSFSARHLLAALLLGALLPLFSLPLLSRIVEKLTPPLTPATLPPKFSMGPAMWLVAAADGLSRAVTPPNLRVLKEVAGAWHAAQIRTAAELRLADFLEEEEGRARRECLGRGGRGGAGGAGRPPPPSERSASLGRRLSCSFRLGFFSPRPSLTSRQLAERAVPRCRSEDERAHASEAAAFAEGSALPRDRGAPLAGCEGVARRVERLLRALSTYGFFEAEAGEEGARDPLLSTRWRNSRASRFLASSPPSPPRRAASSLRAAVLLLTRGGIWGAWGRLPLAVATGRPGFVDPARLGSRGDAAVEALLVGAATSGGGGGDGDAAGGVCPSNSDASSDSPSSASPASPPNRGNGGGAYHPPDDYWHYLESDPSGARAHTFDAAMVELNVASASARAVAEDAPFASLWAAASSPERRRRQRQQQQRQQRQRQQQQHGGGAAPSSRGGDRGDPFVLDVVDVGGGAGELAAEVLRRHSGAVGRAVVVDLPRAVARARRAWACAAAAAAAGAANSSFSSAVPPPSPDECPASLLSLAPHAMGYPSGLRGRLSFSEGTMFSSRSLSAAVERGLGSFAGAEEVEEQGTDRRAAARRRRVGRKSPPRRVQPRRRRLFLLREIIHDWGDAEAVRILTALRKSMGSAEEEEGAEGDDGRASHLYANRSPPHLLDRDDRVLIVGRSPSEKPLRGPGAFFESRGAQDADLLMLAIFGGGGAGERTRGQTRALLERAGLELVAVHPTRSWFSVTEARAKR